MAKNIVLQEQAYKSTDFFNDFFAEGLYNLDKSLLAFALTKADPHLQHMEASITASKSNYDSLVVSLKAQKKASPEFASPIDSLLSVAGTTQDALTEYQIFCREVITLAKVDSMSEVTQLIQSEKGVKIGNKVESLESMLKTFENQIIHESQEKYDQATMRNAWLQIFLILFGLPTLFWLVKTLRAQEILRKKILADLDQSNKLYLFNPGNDTAYTEDIIQVSIDNLRKAADFIKDVTQGAGHAEWAGLNKENKDLNQENLVGELLKMQQHMQAVKEEDERRNWTNEGLNHLNTILRKETELIALAERILAEIIKYIGANQGVLFIVNDSASDNPYLELTAAYAFNRKKYMSRQIAQGEGLAGQAWVEAETIYLKEIPQNYMRITSGLGDSNPKNILVVPLKHEQAVHGVLELASFKLFQPHEISFVERIAENIAVSFAAAKVTENTTKLLDASTEMAEQMRAQEEEMRQSMEELVATQEELQRNQQETSNLILGINSTFGMIEYDTNGVILNANTNFLQVMGYTLEEIKGKKHQMFLFPEEVAKSDYAIFWQKLQSGIIQSDKFRRVGKGGSEVWLQASYVPVKNNADRVYKIIKLAIDITTEYALQIQNNERMEMIEAYEHEMRDTIEQMASKHDDMIRKEREHLEQIAMLEAENEKLKMD